MLPEDVQEPKKEEVTNGDEPPPAVEEEKREENEEEKKVEAKDDEIEAKLALMETGDDIKPEENEEKKEENGIETPRNHEGEEEKVQRQSPSVPVVETSTPAQYPTTGTIRVASAASLLAEGSSEASAATLVQYDLDPKMQGNIQVEYISQAAAAGNGAEGLSHSQVATVEYVTSLNAEAVQEGQQVIQTENGERYVIAAKDVGGIYSFPHGHPYVSGEHGETIATIHPPPPNGAHEAARPDALQAAVESAEVDKVDPMAYSGYDEDPRLLNDAYMQNYSRSIAVSSSLESPTYTQLENAAMSNFNKIHSSSTATTPSSSTSPSIHPPPPPLQNNGGASYYTSQGAYAGKADVNSIYVLQGKSGFRGRGYDANFTGAIPAAMHGELKDGGLAWTGTPYSPDLHRDLGHYAHYVPTAATSTYPVSSTASFEAGADYSVSIPSSSSGSGHHHSRFSCIRDTADPLYDLPK